MNIIKKLIYHTAKSLGYHIGLRPPAADNLRGHLAVLFEALNINCVLDVGAHWGEFGRMLRTMGYVNRIVSWEPVTENFRVLQEESDSDPEWIAKNYALGSVSGESKINVTRQSRLPSFLKSSQYGKAHFGRQLDIIRTQEVAVCCLDEVFEECLTGIVKPNVFLKLDTQGYDMQVLKGGANSLQKVASIQTEISVHQIYEGMPIYLDSIAKLHELGFELSGLFPVTIDKRLWLVEMDCVMVKRTATIGG